MLRRSLRACFDVRPVRGGFAKGVDFNWRQSGTGGMNTQTQTLQNIAKKHLRIETLLTQNSDSLDFHDLAVWSIEAALKAAYEAGKQAAK